MRMHVKQSDGTLLGLTLATKPLPGSELQSQAKALKEKKGVAQEDSSTAAKKRRLNWERGLWRLYLIAAAVWGIGIAGLLALSLITTGGVHRDVLESCVVAAVVLPGVLVGYFLVKAIARYVVWPPLKWIIAGFIQK